MPGRGTRRLMAEQYRIIRGEGRAANKADNPLRKRIRQRITQSIQAQEQSRAATIRHEKSGSRTRRNQLTAIRMIGKMQRRGKKGSKYRATDITRRARAVDRGGLDVRRSPQKKLTRELRDIDVARVLRGVKKARERMKPVARVVRRR